MFSFLFYPGSYPNFVSLPREIEHKIWKGNNFFIFSIPSILSVALDCCIGFDYKMREQFELMELLIKEQLKKKY